MNQSDTVDHDVPVIEIPNITESSSLLLALSGKCCYDKGCFGKLLAQVALESGAVNRDAGRSTLTRLERSPDSGEC